MEDYMSVEGLNEQEVRMLRAIAAFLLDSEPEEREAVVSLFSQLLTALGRRQHRIRNHNAEDSPRRDTSLNGEPG